MKKMTRENYRDIEWLSLMSLADFIAEYTKDGEIKRDAWDFWRWLDKKSKPPIKRV
jgi:hypothetical protein